MKSLLVRGVCLSVLLCTFTLQADVVKLKDGRAIQGIFLGGNSRQIDFLSPGGQTLSFPLTAVGSVTFSALPGAASSGAAPGAPAAAAAPAARPAVMIAAGTLLRGRARRSRRVASK